MLTGHVNSVKPHYTYARRAGGKQDVIRLDFGATASGLGVVLNSLDGTNGNIDNFQIFGSNLVNPVLADNGSSVFLPASGSESSAGGVDPVISLSAALAGLAGAGAWKTHRRR